MTKDLLKQLILANLSGMIDEYDSQAKERRGFELSLSTDGQYILFNTPVSCVYGLSCYEDSKAIERDYSIERLGTYQIEETIKALIIQPEELKQFNIKDQELNKYFEATEWLHSLYFPCEEENVDEDYYGNHDKVRSMRIPVDSICESILACPYMKSVNKIEDYFEYVNLNENDDLKKQVDAYKLSLVLPDSNTTAKKMKL